MCMFYTTTTTKTVDGISGTCIVLQAGLWKQWAKSFRDFGNYFKKFPRFWKPLDTAFKTLETSGQSLNNFGIVATNKVSSARWKQRIVNNGAMVQKSSFQISFFFAKLSNTTIVREKVDFLKMMQ